MTRTAVGTTETFDMKVGQHQGSVLNPLLFAVVMDVLTGQVRPNAPWNMTYADDAVLLNDTKIEA